ILLDLPEPQQLQASGIGQVILLDLPEPQQLQASGSGQVILLDLPVHQQPTSLLDVKPPESPARLTYPHPGIEGVRVCPIRGATPPPNSGTVPLPLSARAD